MLNVTVQKDFNLTNCPIGVSITQESMMDSMSEGEKRES